MLTPDESRPSPDGPLARLEMYVAGAAIGIATLITFIAVVLRYGFGQSFSAADEITIYLIILSVFIAGSRLLRRHGHITIDILIVHLRPRHRLVLQCFAALLGAMFCLVVAYSGIGLVQQSMMLDSRSLSTLRVPMWIPQAIVPIGCGLMAIRFVQLFARNWVALRRPPDAALPPDPAC